jgi:hypothetical protein
MRQACAKFLINDYAVPTRGPLSLWQTSTGSVYMAYRFYSDFAGTFSQSLIQTPTGGLAVLSAQIAGSDLLTIGVPFRLYYTATI